MHPGNTNHTTTQRGKIPEKRETPLRNQTVKNEEDSSNTQRKKINEET